MSFWPQRDVNGKAIQTFGAKWREKDLCGVRPDLLVPVFSSFWKGLSLHCIRHECTECQACGGSPAWMLYWNNAYLCTVHTDLFNHQGSAQSTSLEVALLAKQHIWRTFVVTKIGEQLASWCSNACAATQIAPAPAPLRIAATMMTASMAQFFLICCEVALADVLRSRLIACPFGVCSSSARCKDDEASDKTDLRHEHADTPKP